MKPTAILATLMLLNLCLMPMPASAAAGLTLNVSQGTVGTIVSIPNAYAYGTGPYYIYWGEDDQLISQGELRRETGTISFIVPEAYRGKHRVTLKVGSNYFTTQFTVLPSISLNTDRGTVGSNLTISGKGFNSNETGIRILYDGSPVASNISANSKGSWQTTIKVPASSGGQHAIDAEGTTPATQIEDVTFTVVPQIQINPTSGWVGTVIGIAGTGFASGETNIKVTYDGLTVKTGIAADAKGSWQSSFTIPTSAKGSHEISAFGAATPEVNVAKVSFIVAPGIKLEPASGYLGDAIHVGDSLWVSGVGFGANEAGIKMTFDGVLIASNIIADAKGSWADRIEVPPCTRGKHIIDASGELTKASDIPDVTIIVSPKIEMSPTWGAIGSEVTVRGTGFDTNQIITISFDGAKVSTGTATDAKGNFTASFKIPKSRAGEHTVTVTDPTASVLSAKFTVESTPPPTPQLISPEAGSQLSSIGKTTVAFDWSDVNDPSGVYYVLEVSPSADFASVVIHKPGLTASEYALTEKEALGKGNYYWRVKAVDNADNEGEWTSGRLFKVGGLEWWQVVAIAIACIIVIAIVWRLLSVSRQDEWE